MHGTETAVDVPQAQKLLKLMAPERASSGLVSRP
jgi:hypothetical protein